MTGVLRVKNRDRALALATLVAAVLVALYFRASLATPVEGPLAPPPDSACADQPYAWARADTTRAPSVGESLSDAAFRGDSVRLTNVSFRPGRPGQLTWSGLLRNGTRSTIEIRGYHLEFLTGRGEIAGWSTCRVSMGGEQCGVNGTNLKRPGEIAVIPDTLTGAPPTADLDTARIFWSYCVRP
jgi:hypothetical protein